MTGAYRALVSSVLAGTLAAMVVGFSATARATVMLDQAHTGPFSATSFVGNGSSFGNAQTFTVGLAGILDSVEVPVLGGSPTTLRILATAGGVPIGGAAGSTVLATSSSVTSVANLYTFDLSAAALAVAVGDVLAIELIGTGFWELSFGNAYAAGERYVFDTGVFSPVPVNNWTVVPGQDSLFRTFVEVAMIPEPSALALFAAGLAGLGFAARRSKRAQDNEVGEGFGAFKTRLGARDPGDQAPRSKSRPIHAS